VENPRLPRKTSASIMDVRRRAENIRLFEHCLNAQTRNTSRNLPSSPQALVLSHALSDVFERQQRASSAFNSTSRSPWIGCSLFIGDFAKNKRRTRQYALRSRVAAETNSTRFARGTLRQSRFPFSLRFVNLYLRLHISRKSILARCSMNKMK